MKFEFKEGAEWPNAEFWHDLTVGGYPKVEDLLSDPAQIKEIKNAVKLLESFQSQLEDEGIIEEW